MLLMPRDLRHGLWRAGVAFAVLLLFLSSPALAGPGDASIDNRDDKKAPPRTDSLTVSRFVPGELVVQIQAGDTITIDDVAANFNLSVRDYFVDLGVFVLKGDSTRDMDSLATAIKGWYPVKFCHPNYRLAALQPVQGSFPFSDDAGVGSYADQRAARDLDLEGSHALATGEGVRVGIIDGGVDYTFSELSPVVTSGYDYVDKDTDPFDEPGGPNSGHGTFVAGVVHLVAPDAEIMSYRVSEVSGSSDGDRVAAAIVQAVKDGCRVINLSMVLLEEHSVLKAAIEYAKEHNVIVVAAAGNGDDTEPAYPASDPNVLAVAALDSTSVLSDFSRFGDHIDVCAYGNAVYSPYQNDTYAWWSGTSFASPFVAGLAALLISQNPEYYQYLNTRSTIVSTAVNVDALNPDYAGMLGSGLIDPVTALNVYAGNEVAYIDPEFFSFTVFDDNVPTDMNYFVLSSSNDPIPYTATLRGAGFTSLSHGSGATHDTISFTVSSAGLPVGRYADTLEVEFDGVINNPATAIIDLTVASDTTGSPGDSAYAIPTEHWITLTEGQFDTAVFYTEFDKPGAVATVTGYVGFGDFLQMLDTVGTTEGRFYAVARDSGLAVGLYADTLFFTVVGGVGNPVKVPVILEIVPDTSGAATATVMPPYFDFTAIVGTELLQSGTFYVNSDNDPTIFTASVIGGGSFVQLDTVVLGPTSSQLFTVGNSSLPVGSYVDTILIDVDSVSNGPFRIPVHLHVIENIPDSAYVWPVTQTFYRYEAQQNLLFASVSISTNYAQQAYTVSVLHSGQFTNLDRSSGITYDSVNCVIDGSNLPIGSYIDTIEFQVENAVNSPVYAYLRLSVLPSDTSTGTAYVSPESRNFLVSDSGWVSDTLFGSVAILADSVSRPFTVQALGTSMIIELDATGGSTNDTITYTILGLNPTFGVVPPPWVDTIRFVVDGVWNNPVDHVITVDVDDTTAQPYPDTAYVSPGTFTFEITEASGDTLVESFLVGCSNSPRPYTVHKSDSATFFTLSDTMGMTDDSVYMTVAADGLPVGMYHELLQVYVDSTYNSPRLVSVNLVVVPDSLPPDSIFAWTEPNQFSLTTQPGQFFSDLQFSVYATGGDCLYDVSTRQNDSLVIITDSGGCWDDTAVHYFDVLAPGTPGSYVDTILVYVHSAANQPVVLPVFVTVVDTGGGASGDTAWVTPNEVNLQQPCCFNDTVMVWFDIGATDPSDHYYLVYHDSPEFVVINDSIGLVADTGMVSVLAVVGLPGTYVDTIDVYVDNAENSPLQLVITIESYAPEAGDDDELVTEVGNYPNPFNPATRIRFSLSAPSHVRLTIYNLLGQEVGTLINQRLEPGTHEVTWNADDLGRRKLSSGAYFYRIVTDKETRVGKMLLLK